MRCTGCGVGFRIGELVDRIDEATWERIARRPCNRA